uniref:Uncharacterized protein n=1 Tax=Kalanchoe fedtschenkoi TaxID=63787 RepID=A0A7N0ZV53_KALFE
MTHNLFDRFRLRNYQMGSRWQKVKAALGFKSSCLYVPMAADDDRAPPPPSSDPDSVARFSDAGLVTQSTQSSGPASPRLRLSRSFSRSSKKICAICLAVMKPGKGHAIFTAECSHAFHFQCITSNVLHGNQACPVCRAQWKEVPFQSPISNLLNGKARIHPPPIAQRPTSPIQRPPPVRGSANRVVTSFFRASEPLVFNDDEPIVEISAGSASAKESSSNDGIGTILLKTCPEVTSVAKSSSYENFNVLVHVKAPRSSGTQMQCTNGSDSAQAAQNPRAPVDIVTVLDVSGSMAGTKLALLKRAMGFVIQHLGPSDRLSVVAFSSTARRLFPLKCMNDLGRQEALQAVNSLTTNGGTNIAEGLRKSSQVMRERQFKNPVASIMLLSDGQDTYTTFQTGGPSKPDYKSLIQKSFPCNSIPGSQTPVHAFGFGADHDADLMHMISETSGGTFSFIESESVIQDAFAQCIGGLLSVVAQEMKVTLECVHPVLKLSSIKSGSYRANLAGDSRTGSIEVGDLYADEERDFLVTLNISADKSIDEMSLLKVTCVYSDPRTKERVNGKETSEVRISRPDEVLHQDVSLEVDRQINRLLAAEGMADAKSAAEENDLTKAVNILDSCRTVLSQTASALAGDNLCTALCAELKEIQDRMASRAVYESSGRAYVLSGLSSHSWQRATARGDSTDLSMQFHAYQTPSMVDMVTRSQTLVFGPPSPNPMLRQARSFQGRLRQ